MAVAATLSCAAAGQAQPGAGDDVFLNLAPRLAAATARLDGRDGALSPEQTARAASDAIVAAYFSERYAAAANLYARYQASPLTRLARASGLGATLLAEGEAAPKAQARAALQTLSSEPAGDTPLVPALAQAALGADAMRRDDLPGAVAFFRAAMTLAQRDLPPDHPAQVLFATAYGRHLHYADRTAGRAAVERTERLALDILPEGHPLWIGVWSDMAARAMTPGRFGEAAEIYARVSDLAARHWGEDDSRLYPILQYRAVALSGLGRRAEALEIARLAIGVEGAQPPGDRAMHRELIGGLLLGEGRVEDAIASYREGLALLQGTDPTDLRWPFIQSRLAAALSLTGEAAEARRLGDLAATGFAAKLPATHPARVTAEVLIAKALARSGAPARAFDLLDASVAANEAKMLDAYARSQDVRAVAAANNTLFRDFAWVALKHDRIEAAWRAAQLTSLGELAQSLSRLSYPGKAAEFRAALDAVQAARASEAETRQKLAGNTASPTALAAAIAARDAAERRLDREFPGHAALLRPTPLTLAETQAGLAANEAVVMPLLIEDRNVTILVTADRVAWQESVSPYNSTRKLITRLRESLDAASVSDAAAFDAAAAHELHRRFFGAALQPALRGKTKLIFPAGGPLAQIPPSVLVTRAPQPGAAPRFLVEDYAIAIRPSLKRLPRPGKAPTHGFAGIGAPALADAPAAARSLTGREIDVRALRALPSLPGARAELQAMQRSFGADDSLLLTGTAATEPEVRAAPLGAYRVLAFATHGLVSGQIRDLAEPALVLTPPDTPTPDNDGLLTASEIATLDLAADWVILSACNTAAGKGQGGAVYGGLARAFQLAGARALLVSHWALRDDAATFLSVETLRRAESGSDRADALRRAQLRMIAGESGLPGERHPALWAPFVLIEG